MNWTAVPRLVHPMGGCLPEKRLLKKCQQLESMAAEVVKIAAGEVGLGSRRWSACFLFLQPSGIVKVNGDFNSSLGRIPGHPLGTAWSPVVVDFCSGGGHLGILVAHLLPGATVCLVENKEESLRRAVERVEAQGG